MQSKTIEKTVTHKYENELAWANDHIIKFANKNDLYKELFSPAYAKKNLCFIEKQEEEVILCGEVIAHVLLKDKSVLSASSEESFERVPKLSDVLAILVDDRYGNVYFYNEDYVKFKVEYNELAESEQVLYEFDCGKINLAEYKSFSEFH